MTWLDWYVRDRANSVRALFRANGWNSLTELQRADLICCEMHRLAKVGQHDESAPDLPLPKQNSG